MCCVRYVLRAAWSFTLIRNGMHARTRARLVAQIARMIRYMEDGMFIEGLADELTVRCLVGR